MGLSSSFSWTPEVGLAFQGPQQEGHEGNEELEGLVAGAGIGLCLQDPARTAGSETLSGIYDEGCWDYADATDERATATALVVGVGGEPLRRGRALVSRGVGKQRATSCGLISGELGAEAGGVVELTSTSHRMQRIGRMKGQTAFL